MRTILAALLAGAALILAAGCGGSGSDTAATTASAETTTVETTTATDTTSTDTEMDAGAAAAAAGLGAGCQKVADLSVQFGKALSTAGADGSNTDLDKTAKAYEEFAKQVPEEIRGSFMTLAQAFGQYAKALQGVDLSSGQTPDAATIAKLAEAAQALDNESLTAANTKITAWVDKNCKAGG